MSFPRLEGPISIDCETYDPDLMDKGPGSHRGAYIVGISVCTRDHREYYPVRHKPGGNLDPKKVFAWLNRELSRKNQPKIGANIIYDLEMLAAEGVRVEGPYCDIQLAEPLINETRFTYSLDTIAKRYLGKSKSEDELAGWIIATVPGAKKNNWKSFIWEAPPNVVRDYAIADVVLPFNIWPKQHAKLAALDLLRLYDTEQRLLPVLLGMRQRGVRIDVKYTEQLRDDFLKLQNAEQKKLNKMAGCEIAPWAAASISKGFDNLGLEYPMTPKTNKPSFKAEWLKAHQHPMAASLMRVRKLDKLRGTFIEGHLLGSHIRGRVYGQFNQLRSDEGGTISGRFSSSLPNLQQIPVRSEEGAMLRRSFIPEGGMDWGIADYSQIEFRLMVSDAEELGLKGADKIGDMFRNSNPDFHKVVADIAGIDRNAAKTVNFGLAFGEGVKKLARSLGLSKDAGYALIEQYHEKVPFMQGLMKHYSKQAQDEGEVRTLYNRLRHFNMWLLVSGDAVVSDNIPEDGVERLYTYRALNARIQGSAADMMKRAMVAINDAGLLDVLKLHLTVHDELDVSVPRTKAGKEAFAEMKRVMEVTSPLTIPVIAESGIGANWGDAK